MKAKRARLLTLTLAGALTLAGCATSGDDQPAVPGGHPARGRQLAHAYGCGACHIIPGVQEAEGLLGPPLLHWRGRAFIAGVLPNTPPYLMRWLMTPQAVVPGNAMPDMGVSEEDAADLAAYLYTIR